MRDAERALRGEYLWGDDFGDDEIKRWFEEEKRSYAAIGGGAAENCLEYAALNDLTLFRHVRAHHFPHCLCLGPGSGGEIAQLAPNVDAFIAVEPDTSFWAGDMVGKPTDWRMPDPLGRLDLPDGAIDLVTAICVLHHIPNVTAVLTELYRVLKPGGVMLLREPIVSLGDWRRPRRGVTKNERGIPAHWLDQTLANLGLAVRRRSYCSFGPLRRLCDSGGLRPYQNPALTRLDLMLSAATAKRAAYWRPTLRSAFAPQAVAIVAEKPEHP